MRVEALRARFHLRDHFYNSAVHDTQCILSDRLPRRETTESSNLVYTFQMARGHAQLTVLVRCQWVKGRPPSRRILAG